MPSTVPGSCTLMVAGRAISMDVDRARTVTMVAGVATQVDAVPTQAARALDLALTDPANYLPTVNATLRLLARDDATAPTAESLAALAALAQPAALTCLFEADSAKAEKPGKSGLTPRAQAVRSGVIDAFGDWKTSNRSSGRAVEVRVENGKKVDRATGWTMAGCLVARGASYRLEGVAFDDHAWQPASGWAPRPAPPRESLLVAVEKGR